jgi:hypothetical protein
MRAALCRTARFAATAVLVGGLPWILWPPPAA